MPFWVKTRGSQSSCTQFDSAIGASCANISAPNISVSEAQRRGAPPPPCLHAQIRGKEGWSKKLRNVARTNTREIMTSNNKWNHSSILACRAAPNAPKPHGCASRPQGPTWETLHYFGFSPQLLYIPKPLSACLQISHDRSSRTKPQSEFEKKNAAVMYTRRSY